MAEVTIYHNPRCSTSRHALDALEGAGVDHDVVLYLRQPPDEATLRGLLGMLEDPPADLVRRDARFAELGLDAAALDDEDGVVRVLLEHPELMQRPVLVRDGRAIIGRPKDRVAPFVTGR